MKHVEPIQLNYRGVEMKIVDTIKGFMVFDDESTPIFDMLFKSPEEALSYAIEFIENYLE